MRYFLSTLSIFPSRLEVMIDNKAALTTASLGATWRTRYYAVRAHRLLQEHQAGKIVLTYCPTKLMVADSLTKLATGEVIGVLLAAMDSQLPALTAADRTSVTPGPANRGDIAGDGPSHLGLEGDTATAPPFTAANKALALYQHPLSGQGGAMQPSEPAEPVPALQSGTTHPGEAATPSEPGAPPDPRPPAGSAAPPPAIPEERREWFRQLPATRAPLKPTRRHSVVGPWRWPRRATRAPETPKSASAAAAHEDSLRLAQGRGQARRQEVLTELELRKQLVGSYMAQDESAVMDIIEAKRRDEWSFFSVMKHPSAQSARQVAPVPPDTAPETPGRGDPFGVKPRRRRTGKAPNSPPSPAAAQPGVIELTPTPPGTYPPDPAAAEPGVIELTPTPPQRSAGRPAGSTGRVSPCRQAQEAEPPWSDQASPSEDGGQGGATSRQAAEASIADPRPAGGSLGICPRPCATSARPAERARP